MVFTNDGKIDIILVTTFYFIGVFSAEDIKNRSNCYKLTESLCFFPS